MCGHQMTDYLLKNWCFRQHGNLPHLSFPLTLPLPVCSGSRTALTLGTLAVTLYPAQLPAGATATAINGTNSERVEVPAVTRVKPSPTAWEVEATSRGRRPTAASTPALMEPLTTPTPILIMAAPPPCWLPVEAERAGSGQYLRGTAPPREAAGCWRGRLLPQSPQALQEKGVWTGQAEPHLLISSLETAAPTVWVKLDHTRGLSVCFCGDI